MNYSDADYPQRFFIPKPFASGSGAAYVPIETTQVSNKVNFNDGFPPVYSTPTASGGKFVSRGEMNAIGRMASQNEFYRACGCLNTFDPDLAMAIDGYPLYAVLQYREGTDVFNVISLKDNNKVDFTGSALTQAQINAGISQGSVDGENWGFCNVPSTTVKNVTLLSLPGIIYGTTNLVDTDHTAFANPIGIFRAPRNGNATVVGDYKTTDYKYNATGVIVWKQFDSLSDAQAWAPSSETGKSGSVAYFLGSSSNATIAGYSYTQSDVKPMALVAGKFYSVFIGARQLRTNGVDVNSPIFTDVTLRLELQAAV